MDLIDIFSIFHHQTAEYIFFFSSAHETLSEMDHVLGRKSSLAKFKKLKSQKASFLITLIHDLGSFIGKFVKNTNTWRNQTGH